MTLLAIQTLRAVAALMVVVFHLVPQLRRMGFEGWWPDWLAGGVDVFFIISGFIMWVTTQARPLGPLAFMRRRLVRIAPLYWLLTTVVVAVMLVAPHLLQTTRFGAWHVVASYAFLPATSPATGLVNPVVNPGWTLNYEMFFYVVFGAALALPARRRFAAVAGVLAALVLAGRLLPAGNVAVDFYTSALLLEFVLGMALGRAWLAGRLIGSRPCAWACLGTGFIALALLLEVVPAWPRVVIFGLPSFAIVLGALSLERLGGVREHRLAHLLGDASYSIYLTHFMTLSALGQGWRKAGLAALPGGLWLFGLAATAVSVIVGVLCYRWVEQPLLRRLRDRNVAATAARTPRPA